MSSGDLLDIPTPIVPAATAATYGSVTGGSTPGEFVDTFDFDAASIEYVDFQGTLSAAYAATGVTVLVPYSAKSGIVGGAVWEMAFRRLDTGETFSNSHAYSYQSSGVVAAAGTLTRHTMISVAFTHGAQMDSLAASEPYILRVRRQTTGNTLSGDAQLWWRGIRVTET